MSKTPLLVAVIALWPIAATAQEPPDRDLFLSSRLRVLADPTWDRRPLYPEYRRPVVDPDGGKVPGDVREAMAKAWDLAPTWFQQRLLGFDVILIGKGPMAYREGLRRYVDPTDYRQYMGMPATPPPPLSEYETMAMRQLLHWEGPRYDRADPDTVAMDLLGVLAHEDGHVMFQQLWSQIPGDRDDARRLCSGAFFESWEVPTLLTETAFFYLSWERPTDLSTHGTWDVVASRHSHGVQLADIQAHAEQADFVAASRLFLEMMKSGQWVSPLAAATPEHDFVETYKYVVLSENLTTLGLEIPMLERDPQALEWRDMMATIGNPKTDAGRKVECLGAYLRDRGKLPPRSSLTTLSKPGADVTGYKP